MVKTIQSATLKLVDACGALPDLDTLQIVHFVLITPLMVCGFARMSFGSLPFIEARKEVLRAQMRDVGDLAMDCLRKAKAGYPEGEGRKRTTLRVIELSPRHPYAGHHLDSVKVEEFEE